MTVAPQFDTEAQRLFEDIAEIANRCATAEEIQMVIDRFQPDDIPVCIRPWSFHELIDWFLQHTSLGVILSAFDEIAEKAL